MPLRRFLLLAAAAVSTALPFDIGNWQGEFDDASGVLRSLRSSLDSSFDFSPADVFDLRNGSGHYHTGDITMRWRRKGDMEWTDVNTAADRASLPSTSNNDSSLLSTSFDASERNAPQLVREWHQINGDLVLETTVTNADGDTPMEIGSLGFPIEFNSIFTNRTPVETRDTCVLLDPYIGLHAGYVQATRLTGTSPNLLITPYGSESKLEGWRFLPEAMGPPLMYQTHTFEGFYAWEVFTKAFAENEWNATTPWNEPTSIILQPGESITLGLNFTVAPSVEGIESTAASLDLPVAIGLPGYVLPSDMTASLYIRSNAEVVSMKTSPEDAFEITPATAANPVWKAYELVVRAPRERVRLDIRYSDNRTQTVHYYITDPASETLTRHARYLFSAQYFEGDDVFNRTPSIMTYDYEEGHIVEQDQRVWIAGVQDEGGAASYVAAAMKTAFDPVSEEVQKLEAMATQTIWQHMQYNTDDEKYPKYSVKRSLFFYEPAEVPGFPYREDLDWSGWSSWNETAASEVWRPYNYVWVSALYWSLYRAEKVNPGVLTLQNASWYLDTAIRTIETCWSSTADGESLVDFEDVGLMGETVWYEMLSDLQVENLKSAYDSLRAIMERRQRVWSEAADPFGSEAPWDSTGQEAVCLWSKYFGDRTTVDETLRSIRAYMPSVAHWAYHGNARRWWDFDVAGKLQRIERQIHHYASPLNAVPLLDAYQGYSEPSSELSIHDLRVGYGGWLGALSNINADGFAGQAFHAFPDTLKWDGYSSDYGVGLAGHMMYSMTTLLEHPDFGFVAMAGNVQRDSGDDSIVVSPCDTVRRRIYVAPVGLWLEISAGHITEFTYHPTLSSVIVRFGVADDASSSKAVVTWEDSLGSGIAPVQSGGSKSWNQRLSICLPSELVFSI